MDRVSDGITVPDTLRDCVSCSVRRVTVISEDRVGVRPVSDTVLDCGVDADGDGILVRDFVELSCADDVSDATGVLVTDTEANPDNVIVLVDETLRVTEIVWDALKDCVREVLAEADRLCISVRDCERDRDGL